MVRVAGTLGVLHPGSLSLLQRFQWQFLVCCTCLMQDTHNAACGKQPAAAQAVHGWQAAVCGAHFGFCSLHALVLSRQSLLIAVSGQV
jgi:hypothetical protein